MNAAPEGQRMMPVPDQFPPAGDEDKEIELFVHPQRWIQKAQPPHASSKS